LRQTDQERLPPLMDAKKEKTRRESSPIKVWVTPEEKSAIKTKAGAHSLSASSYLRRLGVAIGIPHPDNASFSGTSSSSPLRRKKLAVS